MIFRQPAVGTADQFGFVSAVVFPTQPECARMLGNRSLEVGHRGEPIPTRDAVNLAIPCAAATAVVQPLDRGTRQSALAAAEEINHLFFARVIVTSAVEGGGAGGRVKLAIEGP